MSDQIKKEKISLSEEQSKDVFAAWEKTAKNIKTTDDLVSFIKSLQEDYAHDYGTIIHAIAAGMMATLQFMDNGPQGGITGFQASCLMHLLIPKLSMIEPPYRIIQYRDMLYPQYGYKFEKILSKSVWKDLQKKASDSLAEDLSHKAEEVVSHWRSIADGVVPFGFTVKED